MAKEKVERLTVENYYFQSNIPFTKFELSSLANVIYMEFRHSSKFVLGRETVWVATHTDVRKIHKILESGEDMKMPKGTNLADKYEDKSHWFIAEYDFKQHYYIAIDEYALTDDEFLELLNLDLVEHYTAVTDSDYIYDYSSKLAISRTIATKNQQVVSRQMMEKHHNQIAKVNLWGIFNITESTYKEKVFNNSERWMDSMNFDAVICRKLSMGFLEEKSMESMFGTMKNSEIKMIRKWRKKVLNAVIKGRGSCKFKETNGEKITIAVLNPFLDNGFSIMLIKSTPLKYYVHILWNDQKKKGDKLHGKFVYVDNESNAEKSNVEGEDKK
jgi:hypothetical protein